ncbi:phytanoyl-CoA dioxygenase family protein [Streptomyces sp. NPDC097595]|uniref:phytanoyl-CoA dioxygenase family protein n=1 Tax=Streptomyces sp. NPDC097595 TaxID=3366090 RepID=UPI003827992C
MSPSFTAEPTAEPTSGSSVAIGALEDFPANGFAVLRDLFSADEVDGLRREASAVCRGERGSFEGLRNDGTQRSDEEVMTDFLAIHYPHKISEVFADVMRHPTAVRALTRVIGPNVKAMQSMLFIKAAGKPGQAWHQDEHFIPTRDRSLTGLWIALDDATVENGCLWVLPGSHRRGVLYPSRVQSDEQFDCNGEAHAFPHSDDEAVPVEVPAGSAVLFNGYLLHRSLPNTARTGLRRALVNHYMSAESLLPWQTLPEGTHIGEHDYRDITLVAGSDPYAYKGTEDIARSYVRPSGEGGCDR